MKAEEKNGQFGLIVLLVIMIAFGVYQIFISPLLKREKEVEEPEEIVETEEERIARISEELYQVYSLTLEEESILTTSDKAYLDEKLTLYNMSDQVKIYLGLKNLDSKYYTKDSGYSLKNAVQNANGNYYYEGTYIMIDAIDASIQELFGVIPVSYQTFILTNVRYVYDEINNLYEVWTVKKETESSVEKITYKEVVNNGSELYIYEYVAYTDFSDIENLTTSTVHNSSIEVIITEDNVQEYLNYMDKYRYTFTKQDDGTYLFKSIEYVEE